MAMPKHWPRLIKEPTGWVLIIAVAAFFYVQWPTRAPAPEVIPYETQVLEPGLSIRWESTPIQQSTENPEVWGLTRKGMSFLVQRAPLSQPFEAFVTKVVEQDQKQVGGAVQTPLSFYNNQAYYALFDAESRIQEHRVFAIEGQWVKVSVLYKPSLESRVERAKAFLNSVTLSLPDQ